MIVENTLERYNWDDGGKIKEIPPFNCMKEFLKKYSNIDKLDKEVLQRDISYDISSAVREIFDIIANNFKTKKAQVTLYDHRYNICDTNNIFFWENEINEVFYIRPLQMIGIFEDSIEFIVNRFFTNSIEVKTMTNEESDYYWNLMEKDEKEADIFRRKFYTSLEANSSKEVLELCDKYILESISNSFEMLINKRNYNGDKVLKDEILNFIKNTLGNSKIL